MSKKELVVEVIKKNTKGFTILEIAKKLKISRNAIPVIYTEVKSTELIRIHPIGKAKLNYWRGKEDG